MTLNLKVDKFALDVAAILQVDMRETVATEMTYAEEALAAAEATAELMYAQLVVQAHQSPAVFNLTGKPTAEVLKCAVLADAGYQAALAEVRAAKQVCQTWRGVNACLDDRRRMIESLVQLHGRNYWADPRMSEADRAAVADTSAGRVLGSQIRRRG